MRAARVTIELDVDDLNALLHDIVGDAAANVRVMEIQPSGIRAAVKLLWMNIDFIARPSSSDPNEISIEVTAHRLMPTPVVQWQLKEAVKDAPPGVYVLQQTLRAHIPSLLGPFGVRMGVKELKAYEGYVRVALEGISLPDPKKFMAAAKGSPSGSGAAGTTPSTTRG